MGAHAEHSVRPASGCSGEHQCPGPSSTTSTRSASASSSSFHPQQPLQKIKPTLKGFLSPVLIFLLYLFNSQLAFLGFNLADLHS